MLPAGSLRCHAFGASSSTPRSAEPASAVLCGNLEDAIPMRAKQAACAGFVGSVKNRDLGDTALRVRVQALKSPWVLDDLAQTLAGVGHRIEAVMIPKRECPWDTYAVGHYQVPLEARHQIKKPILLHALLERAEGSKTSNRTPKSACACTA
jgi:malyl-CoA/(S)-citramalyl-CoA lyase